MSNCPPIVTNNWHLFFYKVAASKSRNDRNLYAMTEGSVSRNVKNSTSKCLQAVVFAKRRSWGRRPHDRGFSGYRICVKHEVSNCSPIVTNNWHLVFYKVEASEASKSRNARNDVTEGRLFKNGFFYWMHCIPLLNKQIHAWVYKYIFQFNFY